MPLKFEKIKEFITEENGFHKPSGENYRLFSVDDKPAHEDIVLHLDGEPVRCMLKIIRANGVRTAKNFCLNNRNWNTKYFDRNHHRIKEFVYIGKKEEYICVENVTELRNRLQAIKDSFSKELKELYQLFDDPASQSAPGNLAAPKDDIPTEQTPKDQNSSKDNKTPPTIEDVRKFNEHLLEGTDQKYRWWADHKNIFVMSEEEKAIQDYNNRCTKLNHVITLGYPFEAVVGNPYTADIIVVSHNPQTPIEMLDKTLMEEQKIFDKSRWEIYQDQHDFFENPQDPKYQYFPAYNLNSKFTGPFSYWERMLLGDKGIIWQAFRQKGYSPTKDRNEIVNWFAKHIAFVELFGYHSANFDEMMDLSKLEHTKKTKIFIENAIEKGKLLFFRGRSKLESVWFKQIEKLKEYTDGEEKGPVFFGLSNYAQFTTGNIMHGCNRNVRKKDDEKKYDDLKAESYAMAIEYLKSKIEEKLEK